MHGRVKNVRKHERERGEGRRGSGVVVGSRTSSSTAAESGEMRAPIVGSPAAMELGFWAESSGGIAGYK